MRLLIEKKQDRWTFEFCACSDNSAGTDRQVTEGQVGHSYSTNPPPTGSNQRNNLNLPRFVHDSETTAYTPIKKTSKRRQSLNLGKRLLSILCCNKSMDFPEYRRECPNNDELSGYIPELESTGPLPEVEGEYFWELHSDPLPRALNNDDISPSNVIPDNTGMQTLTQPRAGSRPANPASNNNLAGTPNGTFSAPYTPELRVLSDSRSSVSQWEGPSHRGSHSQVFYAAQHDSEERRISSQNSPISPASFHSGYRGMVNTQMSLPHRTNFSPVSSVSSGHTAVCGQASPDTLGPTTGLAVGFPPTTQPYRSSQGTYNHHNPGFASVSGSFSTAQSPPYVADNFGSAITNGGGSSDGRQHHDPTMQYSGPDQWNTGLYDIGGGLNIGLADHGQQYDNDVPPPSYESLEHHRARPAPQMRLYDQGIDSTSLRRNQANQGTPPRQPPRVSGSVPATETVHQAVRDVRQTVLPNPVPCDECNQTFSGDYRRGNLRRHKTSHHRPGGASSSTDNRCHLCPKSYRRPDALIKHLRKVHGVGNKKKRRRALSGVEGIPGTGQALC